MAKQKSEMSIAELEAEIERKMRELPKLHKQRTELQKQLDDLDSRIEALEGRPPQRKTARRKATGRRPGRPRGRSSGKALVDYIKDVLADVPEGMRIKDVAEAVKKAGYRSASKDFYSIVATALRESDAIQKIGRGVYKLKGGRPRPAPTAGPGKTTPGDVSKQSLADALATVMEGQGAVKVSDAAEMVQKAGYKTKASQFAQTVSRTLAGDERFTRVAHGTYALKGGARGVKSAAKSGKTSRTKTARKSAKKTSRKKSSRKRTGSKGSQSAGTSSTVTATGGSEGGQSSGGSNS